MFTNSSGLVQGTIEFGAAAGGDTRKRQTDVQPPHELQTQRFHTGG